MSQQLPTPQLLNQVANFIKVQGNKNYFCLFLLGSKAGLRISEAVNFNLSLKKKSNLYLIQGKKHKKRSIYISPAVIKELKKNNWQPKQTNRFSFAHFLQKVKKDLNISPNIELTPHTLRRCFATYQANFGMSLPILQKVLGHSSIRTTALYWKTSDDPKEKVISDKWLWGKESPKPVKKTKEPINKFIAINNNWKIFLNIQQETNIFIQTSLGNSEQELLIKNKNLKKKLKQLEQENNNYKKTIENLKNDKENLTKQLLQVQKEKDNLLKLISADLKKQQTLIQLDNKEEKTPELHQQLIAQIEFLAKK